MTRVRPPVGHGRAPNTEIRDMGWCGWVVVIGVGLLGLVFVAILVAGVWARRSIARRMTATAELLGGRYVQGDGLTSDGIELPLGGASALLRLLSAGGGTTRLERAGGPARRIHMSKRGPSWRGTLSEGLDPRSAVSIGPEVTLATDPSAASDVALHSSLATVAGVLSALGDFEVYAGPDRILVRVFNLLESEIELRPMIEAARILVEAMGPLPPGDSSTRSDQACVMCGRERPDPLVTCAHCKRRQHVPCWDDHGICGAPGCGSIGYMNPARHGGA